MTTVQSEEKEKRKRPAYEKRSKVEREFIEVVTDFIEFQDAPIEYEDEVRDRINERKKGRYVICSSTIRKMSRKMDKFGHIEWLEKALKERMNIEMGDYTPAKPGRPLPLPGDIKTYSILTDEKGRVFARVPTCALGLKQGEKILVEFKSSKIIITPKKEIK